MSKNTKLSANSTIVPFIRNMVKITFIGGIWNTVAFVFFTFNDNLLIFDHSVTLFNSYSVVLASLRLVCLPHNVVSSAYVMQLKCEVDCAMSFMYIMNSKGPSIEPWELQSIYYQIMNVINCILHIVFFPSNSFSIIAMLSHLHRYIAIYE